MVTERTYFSSIDTLTMTDTTSETRPTAESSIETTLNTPWHSDKTVFDGSSSGFNPSTVDVVVIVVGTVVVAIFFFGLCYSCIRLMSRRRNSFNQRRHRAQVHPTPPAGQPFTVPYNLQHESGTTLPPYSPPPVFPDEPPPQYTPVADSQPWRASSHGARRT